MDIVEKLRHIADDAEGGEMPAILLEGGHGQWGGPLSNIAKEAIAEIIRLRSVVPSLNDMALEPGRAAVVMRFGDIEQAFVFWFADMPIEGYLETCKKLRSCVQELSEAKAVDPSNDPSFNDIKQAIADGKEKSDGIS